MRRLTALLCALFVLALAAPLMAADNAKPERQEQFGDLTVHYNAFASGNLQPSIAQEAGVIRSKSQGVLNIVAIKDGKTVPANVTGSVKDLTGRSKPLTFKQSNMSGSVNYLAQFAVDPDASAIYTFTVNVKAGDGDAHAFSFNQEIFSDQ
ncbi:DUF4426 domain-containing protein [Pseudomonas huanghezhanensis]|uniref:DUF4426 domain-containing protein n=1 Tax=Pseudomonas huanghezhanensis TaxID=3002903 RepID=UPI0022863871|nr:DUF4426 domain-containing protein [Pseudomonas sp. BSw22131]